MNQLYWRLRAWLHDEKWLIIAKVKGWDYVARNFDEAD